ncbi:membrane protein [Micromonospora pattaloongensis]|uniref:Membrane protein n=1 Tax=Micromonospora pattaloongensis TaxID=405436 RepID=A0A1H3S721_9ACTN|nr:YihY/virulence factor BrkB family protein [Micromonospora pattaloongensis]SDZ33836.1 membrane protein [Micromonospora pattaloongensis]
MTTTTRSGAPYAAGRRPLHLRQLTLATWRGVAVRSAQQFMKDKCTDWAAALTYYAVLALFPALIVIVALVGLVSEGSKTVGTIIGLAREMGAGSVVGNPGVVDAINGVVNQQSSASVLLSFGVLGALWSASGYVGAFSRASNGIYGVDEGRSFVRLRALQLGVTALVLVLLAVVATLLIVSGPVANAVGDALHLGDAPRTAWNIVKWPLLVAVMMLVLALLFWFAPNVEPPRFRWLTVGGAVTLVVWALASVAFGIYVANFGSYDATYGSLGAIIAFLVWLYLSNCALLFGVEVNAELQRGRAMQAGELKPDEPLPPKVAPEED